MNPYRDPGLIGRVFADERVPRELILLTNEKGLVGVIRLASSPPVHREKHEASE